MLRKAFAMAAAVAAVGAGLVPSLARAQEVGVVSDAIGFVGAATITSGSSCGVFVCLMGGSGTFNFNSIASVCVSDPDVLPPNNDGILGTPLELAVEPTLPGGLVPTCHINVTGGTFHNTVCGTGDAEGTATITGEPEGPTSAPFNITFIATVGVVTGSFGDDPAAVGIVQISSTGPAGSPLANQCVGAFNVAGALLALEVAP